MQFEAESLLRRLVNIPSPTRNAVGVNQIQKLIADELKDLGFSVVLHPQPSPHIKSGDFLVAERKGVSDKFISFVTHADTVLSSDPLANSHGAYRLAEQSMKAHGSGIIDNKGGVVIALTALKQYLRKIKGKIPDHSLRFICSPNEEAGSPGFLTLLSTLSKDSVLILGFEPALDDGSIIGSRRGNRWYEIRAIGRAAHAGRCEGEELNAAHELALKVAQLHQLNKPRQGVSLNVGSFEGGGGNFNVVCGEAVARIDTRFRTFEEREDLHKKIVETLSHKHLDASITGQVVQTSFSIVDDCPPFNSETYLSANPVLSFLKASISRIEGREIQAKSGGGAGDVNYMSRPGAIIVDGLGPIGGGMHTKDEFIYLPSLATRAQAVLELLLTSSLLLSDIGKSGHPEYFSHDFCIAL